MWVDVHACARTPGQTGAAWWEIPPSSVGWDVPPSPSRTWPCPWTDRRGGGGQDGRGGRLRFAGTPVLPCQQQPLPLLHHGPAPRLDTWVPQTLGPVERWRQLCGSGWGGRGQLCFPWAGAGFPLPRGPLPPPGHVSPTHRAPGPGSTEPRGEGADRPEGPGLWPGAGLQCQDAPLPPLQLQVAVAGVEDSGARTPGFSPRSRRGGIQGLRAGSPVTWVLCSSGR